MPIVFKNATTARKKMALRPGAGFVPSDVSG
jgi:hypothetical protein